MASMYGRGWNGRAKAEVEDGGPGALLPRCYPETRKVVGATGFEPATPCAQGRCATRLRYAPTPVDLTPNDHRTRIASVVEGPTRRSSSPEITGVLCAFVCARL